MWALAVRQITVPVLPPLPNPVEITCANPKSRFLFLKKTPKFPDLGRLVASPLHYGRTHFAPMAASSASDALKQMYKRWIGKFDPPTLMLTRSQIPSTFGTVISVGSADYVEEPATKVKFLKSLKVPGCSTSLSLLGTGYREKVFAIIGVKVYAAGLYANPSVFKEMSSAVGNSSAKTQEDLSLFASLYTSPLEKSLQIVLVRDINGETFWNALNDALSAKLKTTTPVDEAALTTFKGIFEGRPLKKGTLIYLTWLEPSKMLVSVSSDAKIAGLDGQVMSLNVTKALFDVFFGDSPVSPSLKDSVSSSFVK